MSPEQFPAAQERIVDGCRHPSGDFDRFEREEIDTSIPDRFESMVAAHPDRVAIRSLDGSLHYAGLNARANRIARVVRDRGIARAAPVVVAMEKSASLAAAILGVLKAGRAGRLCRRRYGSASPGRGG